MKKKYPSDELAVLHVRMPHEVHRKLKVKAKREGRTMNAQAVQMFIEGLSNHPKRRAADRQSSR